MKLFKKMMALMIAVIMCMAMTMTVYASGDETEPTTTTKKAITINNGKAGHTYTLYQIFTGTVDGNELKNIQWGDDAPAALKTDYATAAAAAKVIAELGDARTWAQGMTFTGGTAKPLTADGEVKFDNLDEGYYVVIDENNNTEPVENDFSSAIIVKLVKDVTMDLKGSKPSSEKKVQDVNDSDDTVDAEGNWKDSADYDIGDSVPFKITATTADNVTSYKKYHITFQDKKSEGLNAPTGNYTITVLGKTITLPVDATSEQVASTNKTNITAEIVTPETGYTFAIKVTLEPKEGTYLTEGNNSDIVVSYFMELNESAKLGAIGNPNDSHILYSNNPESTDDNDEGKTPEDRVKVFTYKTVIDKIDETGADLNGAGFTLYKMKSDYTLPTTGTNEDKNTAIAAESEKLVSSKVISAADDKHQFSFVGLDDGTYVLCETTTPDGYNTMAPVLFTISATHEDEAEDPQLLTLTGTAPFTNANATTGNVEVDKKNGTKHNMEPGELYTEIENNSGAELPSTGGIGTTAFYIIGAILVIGAGIVLVTRRRMSVN